MKAGVVEVLVASAPMTRTTGLRHETESLIEAETGELVLVLAVNEVTHLVTLVI